MLSVTQTNEAGAVLDDVLAQGFKNNPHNDHFMMAVAKWRIYLAQKAGDKGKAVQVVRWVNGSNCSKKSKAKFLKAYGTIAGLQ